MKRVCKECGAAIPDGHPACPLCGQPAPPLPIPDLRPEIQAFAREAAAERGRALRKSFVLRVAEALLFVAAVPVLLPGFAFTALIAKRWGHIPLSLILAEGVLLTGLSYLGFERGEGPLSGLVFPLLLASCLAVAALYVLRASKGRAESGLILGYAGLTTVLMMAGGAFFYAGAGLVVHRTRAARFLKIVSDVPRTLSPAQALAAKELLVHVELAGARLDGAHAAWHAERAGVDVFYPAVEEEALEASASDLFQRAADWAGRRVILKNPDRSGVGRIIPEDWRAFLANPVRKGPYRFWMPAGGVPKEKVYLVSALLEEEDKRIVTEVLDFEAPAGLLAGIPMELLESTNGLDQRGRHPGEARGLAILVDAAPRVYCAPVEGTSGALWVRAPGEEPPAAPYVGVLEWPDDHAAPSLARLARKAGTSARPRLLVLGAVAAYRNSRGLTTEASEGIPLEHWGALLLGALLSGVAVLLALRE